MRVATIHTCERCGKEIAFAEKCYVKTFCNEAGTSVPHTTHTGHRITIIKRPIPRTHSSIGLCAGCMSEAEALLNAWLFARKLSERSTSNEQRAD